MSAAFLMLSYVRKMPVFFFKLYGNVLVKKDAGLSHVKVSIVLVSCIYEFHLLSLFC